LRKEKKVRRKLKLNKGCTKGVSIIKSGVSALLLSEFYVKLSSLPLCLSPVVNSTCPISKVLVKIVSVRLIGTLFT